MRIGPMEVTLILIVVIMVFGIDNLPKLGAKAGDAMKEFRGSAKEINESVKVFKDEMNDIKHVFTEEIQEKEVDDKHE